MDMAGNTTRIGTRSLPLMMVDLKTILYEDRATELLQTCGLQGHRGVIKEPHSTGLQPASHPKRSA